MNEKKSAMPAPAGRPLAALLRFLATAGKAKLGAGDPLSLKSEGGRTATVAADVVREAVRLGLAVRNGDELSAAAGTRTYLRRLLAGVEGYQDQHRDIAARTVDTASGRQAVRVNQLESPLSALARLKDKAGTPYLGESAVAAGERLARDFLRCGLQPRLTMSWEPRLAGRNGGELGQAREISDTAVAARQRLQAAIEAMGPELAGVALDVCCFMKGLETVERERQWPVRSAKLMLRAALMALSRHYAPAPPPQRRSHSWGAEGFRPDMADRFGRAD
ncbi:hypothetical protein SAMN05892877_101388 [Rhizobium subbaraonis]|uniref:DUF6456 domain-containing protein n=1 Tax=Rhizobium subbaraonis TaxID=908946 RepID=A0A285U0Z5_9HYPH|nr:DUF6456 domain-containing protein [Rhizobium subbaraonis]SOC35502.1 hypothetical protein SAMN05892877_101388 [Rhizobium subbaraonis]